MLFFWRFNINWRKYSIKQTFIKFEHDLNTFIL